MQNRRQHFRYAFTPHFYWKAQFLSIEGKLLASAEIVNLSIGGICVKTALPAEGVDRAILSIALSTEGAPLRIPVQRVYGREEGDMLCGFRFLPLANAGEQEEHERRISRFLLDAQRRDRHVASHSQP